MAYQQVRELLGKLIIGYLNALRQTDLDKLNLLVGTYNNTIKSQALEDNDFFDCICDLVRVSTDSGYQPLSEYLEKSGGILYYFSERGAGIQHKVLFANKALPVIDASWGVEEKFLKRYAQRRKVPIERLSAGFGMTFKPLDTVDDKWQALEQDFYLRIHKETKAVEFDPETIPAILVKKPPILSTKSDSGSDISADDIKQMIIRIDEQNRRQKAGDTTLLHLNTRNSLIRQLRGMSNSETFDLAVTCIYYNAVTVNQHYATPENAESIFINNNKAYAKMIQLAQTLLEEQQTRAQLEAERDSLKQQLPDIQLTDYRSCFFAFDYKIDDNFLLLDAIQEYFKSKNFGIKVMAPAMGMDDLNLHRDLHQQLKQAHFWIAEISNNNLNVLYESGLLHGMGKPLILLCRMDSTEMPPFDIYSDYRCHYEVSRRGGKVRFIWLDDEMDKVMSTIKRMLPKFDTVSKWIEN